MSLDEKTDAGISEVERRPSSNTPPSTAESGKEDLLDGELLSEDVRPAAERRLVRILDMRLLPTIILIYIMNYIDVSSLLNGVVLISTHCTTACCCDCCETQGLGARSRSIW